MSVKAMDLPQSQLESDAHVRCQMSHSLNMSTGSDGVDLNRQELGLHLCKGSIRSTVSQGESREW